MTVALDEMPRDAVAPLLSLPQPKLEPGSDLLQVRICLHVSDTVRVARAEEATTLGDEIRDQVDDEFTPPPGRRLTLGPQPVDPKRLGSAV